MKLLSNNEKANDTVYLVPLLFSFTDETEVKLLARVESDTNDNQKIIDFALVTVCDRLRKGGTVLDGRIVLNTCLKFVGLGDHISKEYSYNETGELKPILDFK